MTSEGSGWSDSGGSEANDKRPKSKKIMTEESKMDIKALTKLLEDEDFLKLTSKLSAFNPFEVLKLKTHEIRHSNVLAWLLNPKGSHNLGKSFLEQFLYILSEKADNDKKIRNTNKAVHVVLSEKLNKINVRREVKIAGKKSIDIFMECFTNSTEKPFAVLIENKVYSTQEKKQLDDYLIHTEKEGKYDYIFPVYLTLDESDEPKGSRCNDYFHITYLEIEEILEKIITARENNSFITPEIEFIQYYNESLKELLRMNIEAQELAKEIYRNYREVIDFISANGETSIAEAGNNFIKQNNTEGLEAIKSGNSKFFPFIDSVLKTKKAA